MLFRQTLSHRFPHRRNELQRLIRGIQLGPGLTSIQLAELAVYIRQNGENFWAEFSNVPDAEIYVFVKKLVKTPPLPRPPSPLQNFMFRLAVIIQSKVEKFRKRVAIFFTF